MEKPDAPATGRNREPILAHLQRLFVAPATILEIGSGTGQHAVYFGRALPHLNWQTSDRAVNHPGIEAWRADAGCENVLAPLTLDVLQNPWPEVEFDHAFTANTAHIMRWRAVESMVAGVGTRLPEGGLFVIYGPFNYGGEFTSPSNAAFDASLRRQPGGMGLRDFEALVELASTVSLHPLEDNEMPANNRLLVFEKETT